MKLEIPWRGLRPQSGGIEEDQATEQIGEAGREFGGQHPTERRPDRRGALQTKRTKGTLVGQNDIEDVIYLVDRYRVHGIGAGKHRRIHREPVGEALQKIVPEHAAGGMQVHQRGPRSGHLEA